VYYPLGN